MCKGVSGVRGYAEVTSEKAGRLPARRERESWEQLETPLAGRNVKTNEEFEEICGQRGERQLGFTRNFAANGVGRLV